MPVWLAVACGGGGGALLRWLIANRLDGAFPLATLCVNVVGSFAIGLLYVWLNQRGVGEALRAGILVGLLGGFTTFSAFSLETVSLIEQGEVKTALLYVASSLIICLVAAFLGLVVARDL